MVDQDFVALQESTKKVIKEAETETEVNTPYLEWYSVRCQEFVEKILNSNKMEEELQKEFEHQAYYSHHIKFYGKMPDTASEVKQDIVNFYKELTKGQFAQLKGAKEFAEFLKEQLPSVLLNNIKVVYQKIVGLVNKKFGKFAVSKTYSSSKVKGWGHSTTGYNIKYYTSKWADTSKVKVSFYVRDSGGKYSEEEHKKSIDRSNSAMEELKKMLDEETPLVYVSEINKNSGTTEIEIQMTNPVRVPK